MTTRKRDYYSDREHKPTVLPVNASGIPTELRLRPQWVCWRLFWKHDKWTKLPIDPGTGRAASASNPKTWGTFDEALAESARFDGIGYVFAKDDPYCGIDLDDAVTTTGGKTWAKEIVGQLESYVEFSPSKTGVKLIAKGKLPPRCKHKLPLGDGEIEVYDHGRFFALTGCRLKGAPATVEDRQAQLDTLLVQCGMVKAPALAPSRNGDGKLTDAEIIAKAMTAKNGAKFRRLWAGDTSDYSGDDSRADLALVTMLAFWTQDSSQIDSLFRQSGLYREKWDREDYRQRTIDKALEGQTEFYRARGKRRASAQVRAAQNAGAIPEADDDPHRLARIVLRDADCRDDCALLRRWNDSWQQWENGAYREIPDKEIDASITRTVKAEFDRLAVAAAEDEDGKKQAARKVTTKLLADVRNALASEALLSGRIVPPAWIVPRDGDPAPVEMLACRNGLIHLSALVDGRTDYMIEPTPRLFIQNAMDYDFKLDAPRPEKWHSFLNELWPDDAAAIETLQEIAGYLLTPDTRQQKIVLLVGPRRSGKGTIARVLHALLGPFNCCGATLASFAQNFGLQGLLGKSVAIISDARLSGRTDQAQVTERLLSISGEDVLPVDRKYREPVHIKLPTRLVLLTNEIPRLSDASGALVGRLIVLKLARSFYGQEDVTLTDKLLSEVPSILLWAIDGWNRLRKRGRFVQPDSGRELVEQAERLSSPISAFIADRCQVHSALSVNCDLLFREWCNWCELQGQKHTSTVQVFGRDLAAAQPTVQTKQIRDGDSRIRVFTGIGLR